MRWKMNRIGFVNFWLYDEETFAFEDGKLLLRGQNGSGKSITTQSFIPFILDGDRTPSRLDPFGSSDRRMEYYFLGEEGKDEATGYLFLEFTKDTKEDTKEFRTIGIGQRARRGKPMDFWGFVILDGQRIGHEIDLYKTVGSTKIPLAKNEVKKILGVENPFTDVPGEYKALVNKYLFGFSKMEQYEQFIKLLVKVRAPKLSKEFKPTKVYEILNESLQTLTDEDLRAMVDAMEKMDGIQESLEELKRAFSDVRIIRNEYMRYNQYMLAKKGQAYLEKKKEAEEAQAESEAREQEKQQMMTERKDIILRQEEKENRTRVLETELTSLYDTDMEEADRKLGQAQEELEEIHRQLSKWDQKIQEQKEEIRVRESKVKSCEEMLELQRYDLQKRKDELEETQETFQWAEHPEAIRRMGLERMDGTEEIGRKLTDYKREIAGAKVSVEEYGLVQSEYDKIARQMEEYQKEKNAREQEMELTERELVGEQDRLIQEYYKQAGEQKQWCLEKDLLREIEQILKNYRSLSDGERIKELLNQDFEKKRRALTDLIKEAEKRRDEQDQQVAETEEELERVRSIKELEPPRDEQTEQSREAMAGAGIAAIPFFKAVEFAEYLDEQECARLEAQLGKMGILDALVVSEEDLKKIRTDFPEFMDTVLYVEKRGDSSFHALTVNEDLDEGLREAVVLLLSNMYESEQENGGIYLCADGSFRQGILAGKADKAGEAEYVGRLARKRRKERMLLMLEERKRELLEELQAIQKELSDRTEALEQLDAEYEDLPNFVTIHAILEKARICLWNLEQSEEKCHKQELVVEECNTRRNRSYQKMLQSCKTLPYGRTVSEYREAWDAAEEYQRIWQEVREILLRTERYLSDTAMEKERMEQAEIQLDDAFVERRHYQTESRKKQILIEKYQDYLNRPEIKEQAMRIAKLKEEKTELTKEIRKIQDRRIIIDERLRSIQEGEEARQKNLREKIGEETRLRSYFEEELALELVFERDSRSLEELAREACHCLRDSDRGKELGELFNALFQVYQKHNSSLIPYGTTMENCFDSGESDMAKDNAALESEMPSESSLQALRSRVRIVSVWNGRKMYLEEFFQILKGSIEETELLIQQKDRELFEDILSQTISRQLTDRIAESRKWVKDMSALMKNMDTSMGLTFSLAWKPKAAENDTELDTLELEQILLRDRELMTVEDISHVATHFRSKIQTEKIKQEESGGVVNYMEMVREILDYRKWFEFRMSFRKGEEPKKPLTNSAFNRFSGGEKAMAMYVPLFAAVNAQYQKAERKDFPRIIALDEAFAGVDDKNISSMFELVHILDFDYIMNSQALWGCYEQVPALRIAELLRPLNSQIVTVIRYTWNGHERILDEQ